MENIIVACKMIQDEMEKAIRETGYKGQVIWLEDNLHSNPSKLKTALQEEIDKLEEVDNIENILFAYGYCGNSFIGIRSRSKSLVIPKVNDCTQLLLIDTFEAPHKLGYYYLTKGWMTGKENPLWEYHRQLERRGEKVARRIMDLMLVNYKALMLIDTEAYDVEQWEDKAKEFSHVMNLELMRTKGTTRMLNQLVTGPWDHQYCIIPPNTEIVQEHFSGIDTTAMPQGGTKE